MTLRGNTEIYTTDWGDKVYVNRGNTLLDGYIPVLRELQGVTWLAMGGIHTFLVFAGGDKAVLLAKGCFKDGLINLTYSPLTGAAITALAMNTFWGCPQTFCPDVCDPTGLVVRALS